MEVAGKSLPALTNSDKGRYSVVVFENYHRYLNMDKWNRELLDKYCREYGVGVLGFFPPADRHAAGVQVKGFPLYLHTKLSLRVRTKTLFFLRRTVRARLCATRVRRRNGVVTM